MKQKTNNESVVTRTRTKIRKDDSARNKNRFAFTGLVELQKSIVNAIRNWDTLFIKMRSFD